MTPDVFAPWLKDRATWIAWFASLKTIFRIELDDIGRTIFAECSGRTAPPSGAFLEVG
jgi:hypothetical protein